MQLQNGKRAWCTLVATLVPVLLLTTLQAHGRDRPGWTPDWSGHVQDQAAAHRGPPQDRCLAKDALTRRLDFASRPLGRIILGLPDAFSRQLSDFDRGARLRVLSPVSTRQYLHYASNAAAEWTPAEIAEWSV